MHNQENKEQKPKNETEQELAFDFEGDELVSTNYFDSRMSRKHGILPIFLRDGIIHLVLPDGQVSRIFRYMTEEVVVIGRGSAAISAYEGLVYYRVSIINQRTKKAYCFPALPLNSLEEIENLGRITGVELKTWGRRGNGIHQQSQGVANFSKHDLDQLIPVGW